MRVAVTIPLNPKTTEYYYISNPPCPQHQRQNFQSRNLGFKLNTWHAIRFLKVSLTNMWGEIFRIEESRKYVSQSHMIWGAKRMPDREQWSCNSFKMIDSWFGNCPTSKSKWYRHRNGDVRNAFRHLSFCVDHVSTWFFCITICESCSVSLGLPRSDQSILFRIHLRHYVGLLSMTNRRSPRKWIMMKFAWTVRHFSFAKGPSVSNQCYNFDSKMKLYIGLMHMWIQRPQCVTKTLSR